MGGIISYFHGESGIVKKKRWVINSRLELELILEKNVHRVSALDYGTDIGIDTSIKEGDFCRFFRLDDTCGIWMKDGQNSKKQIRKAVNRVLKHREFIDEYNDTISKNRKDFDIKSFIKKVGFATQTTVALDLSFLTGEYPVEVPKEKPQENFSLFLSYSSKNVLLAHEMYQTLSRNHLFDVWFDVDQPLKPTDPEEKINHWLENGVRNSKGLVLLWTKQAAKSKWVQSEIKWALRQVSVDNEFKFIVIKLHDEPIAREIIKVAQVIDVQGLWWSNGINEELTSILYNYPRRSEWILKDAFNGINLPKINFNILSPKENFYNLLWFFHRARAIYLNSKRGQTKNLTLSYGDFGSQSGVVKSFSIEEKIQCKYWVEIHWKLEVIIDEQLQTFVGKGPNEPIDLNIKPGDKIGFYFRRQLKKGHSGEGLPVWIRSEDANISFDEVIDEYFSVSKIRYDLLKSKGDGHVAIIGEDTYERNIAEMLVTNNLGDVFKMSSLFKLGIDGMDFFEK